MTRVSDSQAAQLPRRILAVNFGGIGDEILFFPTLMTLRAAYPEAHLAVLVEPRSSQIMNLAPVDIDQVLTFDIKRRTGWGELLDLVARLRHGAYDLAISSGQSSLVALLLFLAGARRRIGYGGSALDSLLSARVHLRKQQYAARMYHDLVRGLGPMVAQLPRLRIPAAAQAWADGWLAAKELRAAPGRLVMLHPGSSALSQRLNMLKDWPESAWVRLIDLLHQHGYRLILAAGPDDRELVRRIGYQVGDRVIHTGDELNSLARLAALIARCSLLVCIDSAPLHVAVGVDTPVVAIFGPTDPRKLVPPDDARFTAVTVDFALPCGLQPCLWEKRQSTCGDRQCLDKLPAELVFAEVRRRLPLPDRAPASHVTP